MKLRNKDGREFESILLARNEFCEHITCINCPLSRRNNRYEVTCDMLIRDYPIEAARLLGCEVIEENKSCETCDNEYPSLECVNCGSKHVNYREKEPPLGIMPEYMWKQKRYEELCGAIGRYILAGLEPLSAWIDEGRRLLDNESDVPCCEACIYNDMPISATDNPCWDCKKPGEKFVAKESVSNEND